jgi:Transmembrane adaptor Erv26
VGAQQTVSTRIGFYLVIVFLTLGIACALFYLAELIEEFTSTTKRLISYLIRVRCLATFTAG